MTLSSSGAAPLYDAQLRIDEIMDFGYPLATLASGAPLPPSGVRFDVTFSGTVTGPHFTGAVVGVDYLSVRADGRLELHLHARVRTDDGARLAFAGTGLAVARHDAGPLPVFEQVSLHSSDARYLWLNGLPIWGQGTIDLAHVALRVRGFTDAEVLASALQRVRRSPA